MVDLGKSFRRGWKVYVKIVAVLILIILSAGEGVGLSRVLRSHW